MSKRFLLRLAYYRALRIACAAVHIMLDPASRDTGSLRKRA